MVPSHEHSMQSHAISVDGPSPQNPKQQVICSETTVPEFVSLTLTVNSWSPLQGPLE